MRTSYRHKQFGGFSVFASAAAILLLLALLGPAAAHPALLLLLGAVAAVAVAFSSLTVEISPSSLVFWFGPGLLRQTVPLAEIAAVEPVRNPWYYGVGLRLTPRGMLYSVSGLSAVEILRHDGGRFRLGTDEPERLTTALRLALDRFK
jgi:hypothetical protein